MNDDKLKYIIYVIIGLIVVLAIILIIFFINNILSKKAKYTDITYGNNDYCLTFYDNKKYEFSYCDSEPTNYVFDSSNYCKYYYRNNVVEFKCKDNKTRSKIFISNWTNKEINFSYNGQTFNLKKQ